jgi:hypothetical protein
MRRQDARILEGVAAGKIPLRVADVRNLMEWLDLAHVYGAQLRWEKAHGIPPQVDWIDALCGWCGKTVLHNVQFSPRHADSRMEALAICHGLVEYHRINGECSA